MKTKIRIDVSSMGMKEVYINDEKIMETIEDNGIIYQKLFHHLGIELEYNTPYSRYKSSNTSYWIKQ